MTTHRHSYQTLRLTLANSSVTLKIKNVINPVMLDIKAFIFTVVVTAETICSSF